MKNKLTRTLAAIAGLLLSCSVIAEIPLGIRIESDVRVDEAEFRRLFDAHRFYEGEKITIQASGTIDAHHQYWEERVCKWFGASCKYENRERATITDTSKFPVILSVQNISGVEVELIEQIVDSTLSTSVTKHVPLPAPWTKNQIYEINVLTSDSIDSEGELKAFSNPIQFYAKIVDKGLGQASLYRNRCEGRPKNCGGGSYQVSVINVDTSLRMSKFEKIMSGTVSSAMIIPTLKQDILFINDPVGINTTEARRPKIARVLFEQSKKHKGKQDEIAYLEYAVELDRSPQNADIANALTSAHLTSGNVAVAIIENNKTFHVIEQNFNNTPNQKLTEKVVEDYYNALRIAAQINVVNRGGIISADLNRAVGIYIKASEIALKNIDNNSVARTPEIKKKFTRLAFEAYIDASRILMMMRSTQNMEQAEMLLEKAHLLADSL